MRLIDADKLEIKHYVQRVSDKVIRYNGTQPQYANYDILAYDISNAPTVEAIPIEWIDGYIKRRIKVAGMYAEMLFIIDMVKEWEAENDKG